MHPAYSVIVFTAASGAGYGLLALLALFAGFGLVAPTPTLGLAGLGLALTLIGAGLLSSTSHLGRPERAWRAFSQWRTSWLSREGVAAVATFVPTGLLGVAWVFYGRAPGALSAATALCAMATVWCTGMIYASLKTIRAWSHPLVTPLYLALSIGTGGLLLFTLLAATQTDAAPIAGVIAAVALAVGGVLKLALWSHMDRSAKTWTVEDATGLGRFGKVRPLEPAHTQANFVMREMGYRIGRKHAARLRAITLVLLFVTPVFLLTVALGVGGAAPLGLIATVAAAIGVLAERWLFFAEAQHVVTLYYGADRA